MKILTHVSVSITIINHLNLEHIIFPEEAKANIAVL